MPWFENELAIVVAVHAEVEEDLAGARDEDGGADDAPVHAGKEEQEHGQGREGEPGVEVERGQEGHRGSRRVLGESRYEGIGYLISNTAIVPVTSKQRQRLHRQTQLREATATSRLLE